MITKSDADYVAAARSGDKAAFGVLIERHQPMVRRITLSMVRQEWLAQELAQEALLQAYLSLDRLRDDRRFKSWLYGITLNVCRSYLRQLKMDFYSLESVMGGMQVDHLLFQESLPNPETIAEQRELHRLILGAVDSLSPKNKSTTLLFYYEQLSLQEIATLFGVSVTAIKGRLHKSRRQLKTKLLPIYDEITNVVTGKERKPNMIEVKVADVARMAHVDPDGGEHLQQHNVVILLDEVGKQLLPIWIGPYEGDSLVLNFVDHEIARPMTYMFMANLLKGAGVTLESVRIETLKNKTFYALAAIRLGETVTNIDARPSDAINLALIMDCPIYVAEDIMAEFGYDISHFDGIPTGVGIHHIEQAAQTKHEQAKERQAEHDQLSEAEQAEKFAQTKDQLVAFVMGQDG